MTASLAPGTSWTEANQACLVAEFTRLTTAPDHSESGDSGPTAGAAAVAQPQAELDPPPAINALTQTLFGLSAFERDLLLLAAGTEMDSRIAELCPRLSLGVAHSPSSPNRTGAR